MAGLCGVYSCVGDALPLAQVVQKRSETAGMLLSQSPRTLSCIHDHTDYTSLKIGLGDWRPLTK